MHILPKALLRKFIFQIHPDYFLSDKKTQSANATNLQVLLELLSRGPSSSKSGVGDVRKLAFYFKSPSNQPPKRVIIDTNKLSVSIKLALAAEITDAAHDRESEEENMFNSSNTCPTVTFSATSSQVYEFMDNINSQWATIVERKLAVSELRSMETVRNLLNKDVRTFLITTLL